VQHAASTITSERAARETSPSGAAKVDLRVSKISKRFGGAIVLDDLNLSVTKGEFVSLLGPSGCGKTTLLRLIAGLLQPDSGSIYVGGRDLTNVPVHRRNISVVFQNYALFPHLTVAENVAFGLEAKGTSTLQIRQAVQNVLALVRMESFADRRVNLLSGGQQQRIAVARAIVVKPSLLLLDEPFSALDRKLRETMQIELRNLLRTLNITSIFVTHDQEEALVMSDRVAVMRQGQIEQIDTPKMLYDRPASLYVLDFVGRSTQLSGVVLDHHDGIVAVSTKWGTVSAPGHFIRGASVVVGLRPEAMQISGPPQDNVLRLRVADSVFVGGKTVVHFDLRGSKGDQALAESARLSETDCAPGTMLSVHFSATDAKVFAAVPPDASSRYHDAVP
jgi:putative spermidine/putrescine transport system ATP-binding protein